MREKLLEEKRSSLQFRSNAVWNTLCRCFPFLLIIHLHLFSVPLIFVSQHVQVLKYNGMDVLCSDCIYRVRYAPTPCCNLKTISLCLKTTTPFQFLCLRPLLYPWLFLPLHFDLLATHKLVTEKKVFQKQPLGWRRSKTLWKTRVT